MNKTLLRCLINHVFLPPKLPEGKDDLKWEPLLTQILTESLRSFQCHVSDDDASRVDIAIGAVNRFISLTDSNGHVSQNQLQKMFGELDRQELVFPLHILEQNAGLLVQSRSDTVYLEVFELSAENKAIIGTKGRLRRYFPDTAVAISLERFASRELQAAIASMISTMSHQAVPEMQPRVKKAKQMHVEERDTVDPGIATELLTAILRVHGHVLHQPKGIWKNTREEVMYNPGHKLPWRRSPLWLLLRVTLQLTLSRNSESAIRNGLYKRFMVFFMSRVMEQALALGMGTPMIFIMSAKLARRIRKLDINDMESWMSTVHTTMRQANSCLDARWAEVREDNERIVNPIALPEDMEPEMDFHLSALDKFIAGISAREPLSTMPDFQPTSNILDFPSDQFPQPESIRFTAPYQILNLAAFERWVAKHLRTWLSSRLHDATTCSTILSGLQGYHKEAITLYSNMPEGISIMILTILELWVACDKSATAIFPMLLEYRPEVSSDVCESLLLPFQCEMKRLVEVEQYLRQRDQSGFRESIFTSFGNRNSFSVRYFAISFQQKLLKGSIEKRAMQEREAKREELVKLKERHRVLMNDADSRQCEFYSYVDDYGDTRQRHRGGCTKCNLVNRANSISIEIHEWPLPRDELEAQSTVFELDVPVVFSSWRDATIFIRDDVLLYEGVSNRLQSQYTLDGYSALMCHMQEACRGRISLGSTTKPHTVTHRDRKSIAITEEHDVCLNNGMRWGYYDKRGNGFLTTATATGKIPQSCTFKVSSALDMFLQRPAAQPDGPGPNVVIARQSECPENMSVDEYKTLCELPLGHNIIWEKILRQLAMPSVDWKKLETFFFAWQISHQAGPPSSSSSSSSSASVHRASHDVLRDARMANQLISYIQKSLDRLKENWESTGAVGAFTIMATRILSLAPAETSSACLELLKHCRQACSKWLTVLQHEMLQAANNDDDKSRTQFCHRALQAALIGMQTFDVDEEHLCELMRSPEEASEFIHFCLCMNDTSSYFVGEESGSGRSKMASLNRMFVDALMLRCKRLIQRCWGQLIHEITTQRDNNTNNNCLSTAIQSYWPSFRPEDSWSVEAECWLRIRSCSQDGKSFLVVHYNVVTAELLVNGRPLSRLPQDYEHHRTYRTLFGGMPIEVMPSAEPGMVFSATNSVQGHQIHFSLVKNDLLLRIMKEGGRNWDFVMPRLFGGCLPTRFTEDYVHWYDVEKDIVEFRPKNSPWLASQPGCWKLTKLASGWRLCRESDDNIQLLNNSKPLASRLLEIFNPLESKAGIHLCCNVRTNKVDIDIPRLQLQFFISPGSNCIYSRQYRDMYVDVRQSCDTLIGLKNKLLLCKVGDATNNRMILIPDSKPTVAPEGEHVSVTLENDARSVQTYYLDKYLGRLVGNGSLHSKLFLAELHALTSSCLTDPWTQMTGTEEALSIIRSEGVRSFDHLTKENISLLSRIEKLSPRRVYYPPELRVMQVVSWNYPELSFLSQHAGFFTEVNEILEQSRRMAFLFPGSASLPVLEGVDSHLLERDNIRCSAFQLEGFGAEKFTERHDTEYKRTQTNRGHRASLASSIASCFLESDPHIPYGILPEDTPDYLYKMFSKKQPGLSFGQKVLSTDLQYSSKWLEDPVPTMREQWISLKKVLVTAHESLNPHHLMTWLATMAYCDKADKTLLSVLVGLARLGSSRAFQIPQQQCDLSLSQGVSADRASIRELLKTDQLPFEQSDQKEGPRRKGESGRQAFDRRRAEFLRSSNTVLDRAVDRFHAQWPSENLYLHLEKGFGTYFSMNQALDRLKIQFRSWSASYAFLQSLQVMCTILAETTTVNLVIFEPVGLVRDEYARRDSLRNVSLGDVFKMASAEDISDAGHTILPPFPLKATDNDSPDTALRIVGLLDILDETARTKQEASYVDQLRTSAHYLSDSSHQYELTVSGEGLRILIEDYRRSSDEQYRKLLHLVAALGQGSSAYRNSSSSASVLMISETHHWPRVSARIFISQLNRWNWNQLSHPWKRGVVEFALSMRQLQASERLMLLYESNQQVDLCREIRSIQPRQTWDCFEYPDALLLELEGNLRMREAQEKIASTMEKPPNGENKNAVMQLNMGEGKSSVIVPVVAASLSDTSRLVRVIVARPQSRQMFEMLVSKLGGLMGRRVYHMPFSRSLQVTQSQAKILCAYYEQCRRTGGVLLLQPENILSFELMVIEAFIKKDHGLAEAMLATKKMFDTFCRDIVDESDENFSPKFELIYTMGQQRPMDFAPDRWIIIQHILELVAKYAVTLETELSDSLEIENLGQGRFPRVRFLDHKAADQVLALVIDHLCTNGLVPGFPIAQQSKSARQILRRYISEPMPSAETVEDVHSGEFWASSAKESLLLIRGLFSSGLLAFVFEKRWRVNYGLDPARVPTTRTSVPYQSKDKPSSRSEFSHPDVVICLTCLSYYYGGLSDEELFMALDKLSRSDQADLEYQQWASSAPKLAPAFRHLEGINTRNKQQCIKEVFPNLKYAKQAIDYFLSHIVFVKEMKEFPDRLSASGWDIGRTRTNFKKHPTTGFSGTNDSRNVLPLNVEQLDLPSQGHTNALVLEYLLQPENSVQLLSDLGHAGICSADALLEVVVATKMKPEIRVILDVGAQIIEMTNVEVARAWLHKTQDNAANIKAVVFCNEADHVCVLDRSGRIERLQTSPFAKSLDQCLVYLDEAHTRGIDLRLPQNYRAAVTLGAHVVKDRLVQGM